MVCMRVNSRLRGLYFTSDPGIFRCTLWERQGKQLLLSLNLSWWKVKALCTGLALTKNTRQARCENSFCICEKPILLDVSLEFWKELSVGCI